MVTQNQEQLAKEIAIAVIGRVGLTNEPNKAAQEAASIYREILSTVVAAHDDLSSNL